MFSFYGTLELDVLIQKDSLTSPWGFRLQGGSDYNLELMVEKVDSLGAAVHKLKPGDIFLQINGKDVKGLTHQNAIEIIQAAGTVLSLRIKRPPPTPSAASSVSNYAKPPVQTNFSTLPKQWRLRTSGGSSTASSGDEEDNENNSPKIPQNYQLAKIMTATVAPGKRLCPSAVRQKTAQNIFRHHHEPGLEVTQYLPKPPTRLQYNRMTPSGSPTGSASGHDPQLASQVRDSLLIRTGSPSSSTSDRGTASPTTVVEMVAAPGGRGGRSQHATTPAPPLAVGVWTPPLHQPHAKLVHLQYNSPFDLYTPHNVADMIEKTTGTKLAWQKKPPVRFLDDIRESPTYRFVQEIEKDGGRTARGGSAQPQSTILRRLERGLLMNDHNEGTS